MAIDPAAGCQKRNSYSPGSSTLTLNILLPDLTLLDRGLQCLGDTHMLKKKILGGGHSNYILTEKNIFRYGYGYDFRPRVTHPRKKK